jgi:SAM-dependent methyltransferase
VRNRTGFYPIDRVRAGDDALGSPEDAELGDVARKRLVHLQCHFGLDTIRLARRGAIVTGLDFSTAAIAAARALAAELAVPARFVEGNVYDAPALLNAQYDMAFVTWGSIIWLPDIRLWAQIVAELLAPGGWLYLAEGQSFDIVARRGQRPAGGLAELEDAAIGALYLRRDDDVHRRSNAARPHPELRVVSSVE